MQAEYFALEGVSELMDTVDRIRQVFNPNLAIEGVVLTMYDERTNLAQAVTDELKNFFGDRLCSTTIPRNVRLAEAPSHGKPALVYDARSRGAESYIRLAKELMDRHGVVIHEIEEAVAPAEPETPNAEAPISSAVVEQGESVSMSDQASAGTADEFAPAQAATEDCAVDPDDEPLFAWFDPALVEAVAAEAIGPVAPYLASGQQGAD
jgi:hypothetical protein